MKHRRQDNLTILLDVEAAMRRLQYCIRFDLLRICTLNLPYTRKWSYPWTIEVAGSWSCRQN